MAADTDHGRDTARIWLTAAWIVAATFILLAPLVAMRLHVDGVNWSGEDFLFAGGLLFGAGLLYEVTTRRATTLRKRLLIAGLIGLLVLIVWVEAAVGIFH